jgi:hypothetical protein
MMTLATRDGDDFSTSRVIRITAILVFLGAVAELVLFRTYQFPLAGVDRAPGGSAWKTTARPLDSSEVSRSLDTPGHHFRGFSRDSAN